MSGPNLALLVKQGGGDALSDARADVEKYAAKLADAALEYAEMLAHVAVSDAVASRMRQTPEAK